MQITCYKVQKTWLKKDINRYFISLVLSLLGYTSLSGISHVGSTVSAELDAGVLGQYYTIKTCV